MNIHKCHNGHVTLDEENLFQKPCPRCGDRITYKSFVSNPETIFICSICGEKENPIWGKEMNERLIKDELCFTCNFWEEKIQWRKDGNPATFVIKGEHFKVNPDSKDGPLGYDGRPFKIIPADGRPAFVTRNLWHQGTVPEHFRSVLTDNATFGKV